MLVSIGAYDICNGTLSGGVAISDLRLKTDRLFDEVVPVGDVDTIWLDRICSISDFTFVVKRTHPSVYQAEKFILQLDGIPTSGDVTITTTGPSPTTRVIENGFLIDHELIGEYGSTTFHQYHIKGGPPLPS